MDKPLKILTAIASDPRKKKPAHPDHANLLVRTFLTRLEKVPSVNVARVSSVQELVKALDTFRKEVGDPDVLQVVGHGRPGVVDLGVGDWDDDGKEDVISTSSDQSLRLDRTSIGALSGKLSSGCTVRLLGCSVGDAVSGAPDDGPCLLFCLSHMLGAEACAPVDPVVATDLDPVTGEYLKENVDRMTRVRDHILTMGTETPPKTSSDKQQPPPEVVFTRLRKVRGTDGIVSVDLPLVGSGPSSAAVELRARATRLAKRVSVPADPGFDFSSPEYELEARCEDKEWRAEVLGNGRALRLSRPGAVRTFSIARDSDAEDGGARGDLRHLARLALHKSLPPSP